MPDTTPQDLTRLANIAWDAHRDALSPVGRALLPAFTDLPPSVQDAWRAAAGAVTAELWPMRSPEAVSRLIEHYRTSQNSHCPGHNPACTDEVIAVLEWVLRRSSAAHDVETATPATTPAATPTTKPAPPATVLYAFIGEDELGSGKIGLKQGDVPAGRIPLVTVESDLFKIERLKPDLEQHASISGKRIRLVRFTEDETIWQTDAGG